MNSFFFFWIDKRKFLKRKEKLGVILLKEQITKENIEGDGRKYNIGSSPWSNKK